MNRISNRLYYGILIVSFSLLIPKESLSQLYINEIQAANASSKLEKWYGEFSDWIELYNNTDKAINLDGYFLSDDINIPDKYEIPSITIYPWSYKVIYADKHNNDDHTNFSLDGDGEQVLLYSPGLVLIDSISFGAQYPDISYGRYPDGSQNWTYFEDNTPQKTNSPDHMQEPVFAEKAVFSQPGGFYEGSQTISIDASSPTATIRYTRNGSDPDEGSSLYIGPLFISTTTVIRAKVFDQDKFSSETNTQTYIFNEATDLPLISVSTDGKYLWDDEVGIYVVGTNGVQTTYEPFPANYFRDWERPVNIEYYDPDGNQGFNQYAGTRLFGGSSRKYAHKSMAFFARGKYGKKKFEYKLFKDKNLDEFKSFIIRNSGQDVRETRLRDGMMHTLVKDRLDVDYQEYQPAVLYLNGEYWGHLNIREKTNEDYLEANHGVDADSVDIVLTGYNLTVIEGTDAHYQQMLSFLRSNDITDTENFNYMATQMDMSQYIDYQITQIYCYNQDWPGNNNKLWRPQTQDGRWRWLLYDLDSGFGLKQHSHDMVSWATTDNLNATELVEIMMTLLENNEFRSEFLQRFCSHMNTTFQADRVIGIIDSLALDIEDEMPRLIDKFNLPSSMSTWNEELGLVRSFAEDRLPVIKSNLIKRFDLDGTFELSTQVSNPGHGTIEICGVDVPAQFSGSYFLNVPLTVKAIPAEGCSFLGWEGDVSTINNEIELTLNGDASLTALFGPETPLTDIYINELSSMEENGIPDGQGEMVDWIEIINKGSKAINLSGLYLSDSVGYPTKCRISYCEHGSTIIHPDSTIILFADGDPSEGPLHLDFKLSNRGEKIVLSQLIGLDHHIIDSVSYKGQFADITAGRVPDGTGEWQVTLPTPGVLNESLPLVSGLVINEFSASNILIIPDEHEEYNDWIEIYNSNDVPVDIGGMFLTDSLADPMKHRIPTTAPDSTTIQPGDYMILWADNQDDRGIRHLNFGLCKSGEQIGLVQLNGSEFIDSMSYQEQFENASISYFPEQDQWLHMPPTPERINEIQSPNGLIINEFSASNSHIIPDEHGEYNDWIEIYNSNDVPIDIGGMFLTDSLADPMKHRIPTTAPDSTTIQPGGYMILWADKQSEQGIRHLDFSLSRSGEQIGLVQYNGYEFIHSLTYQEQFENASLSYFPEKDQWLNMPPTPERVNEIQSLNGLVINEFSASNTHIHPDEHGEYNDWIEIYNSNDIAVDLGGLFLTDSLADPMKHRIPTTAPDSTTIQAGGYMILWADNQSEQGIRHLGFSLRRSGEQIGLVQYNGSEFIDSLSYQEQFSNASISYFPDQDQWLHMPPTPERINEIQSLNGLVINEFSASNSQIIPDEYGEYNDWIEIYNSNAIAVDLGGLFLTDSLADPMNHRIPTTAPDSTTIQPDSYMILWADNQSEQGVRHLGFSLRRSGEQIGLVQYNGSEYIDSLSYQEQFSNASISYFPDQDQWLHMPPTPEKINEIQSAEGLVINEFSASNSQIIPDKHGEYNDWIEIYNSNDKAVDIGGMFLTDSLSDPMKHRIPTTAPDSTSIAPGGYMILWADNQSEQGIRHLGFSLRRSGEQIGLVQYSGSEFIDSLSYQEQFSNASISYFPDQDQWLHMPPTPEKVNEIKSLGGLVINEFSASNSNIIQDEHGEYEDWIEIYNSNEIPVDIGGLFLTDSLTDPMMHRIPTTAPDSTTIQPGGYMILWADKQSEQGIRHLEFSLKMTGEQIGLVQYNGSEFIDSLSYSEIELNSSLSRFPDSHGPWVSINPTPGWSNMIDPYIKLCINEFRAGNPDKNLTTEYIEGNWIELFNYNDFEVDISGLYISDEIAYPDKYQIPDYSLEKTTIAPGGFLLLWSDSKPEDGILHLNFTLDNQGGQISLAKKVDNDIIYIDTLNYSSQHDNVSTGRAKDGIISWTDFTTPTPGQSNSNLTSIAPDTETSDLNVYPNPVSNGILFLNGIRDISLYNSQGYLVKTKTNASQLNVSSFPSGLYILKTGKGEVSRIIIK